MRLSRERDDAGVVDHFVVDHDVVARLNDLNVVVIRARRHRRAGVEAENAALADPAILGTKSQTLSELTFKVVVKGWPSFQAAGPVIVKGIFSSLTGP